MTQVGTGTWQFQRRGERPEVREARWEQTPLKKRYVPFYAALAENLATMPLDEAAMDAGRKMGWMASRGELGEKALRKKVERLLARPDTPAGIRQAVEAATGFSAPDLMRKLVDHIEGNLTKQEVVVVGKGADAAAEVVEVKIPPSFPALAKLMDVTLPKAPKQVQVDTRMQIQRIGPPAVGAGPPKLRARVLSPTANPALPKPLDA